MGNVKSVVGTDDIKTKIDGIDNKIPPLSKFDRLYAGVHHTHFFDTLESCTDANSCKTAFEQKIANCVADADGNTVGTNCDSLNAHYEKMNMLLTPNTNDDLLSKYESCNADPVTCLPTVETKIDELTASNSEDPNISRYQSLKTYVKQNKNNADFHTAFASCATGACDISEHRNNVDHPLKDSYSKLYGYQNYSDFYSKFLDKHADPTLDLTTESTDPHPLHNSYLLLSGVTFS